MLPFQPLSMDASAKVYGMGRFALSRTKLWMNEGVNIFRVGKYQYKDCPYIIDRV